MEFNMRQWAGELGSMPLGNGDVASNVWVDQSSGSLMFYIAKVLIGR